MMESFSGWHSKTGWQREGSECCLVFSSQQLSPSERVAVLVLTEEVFPYRRGLVMPLVSLQLRIPNCTHRFSIVKLTLGNMNSYLTPKVKVAQLCLTLWPHGLYSPRNSPGQNTGVGSRSLLRGSSQPRDWMQVSCIAGGFFTSWATREDVLRITSREQKIKYRSHPERMYILVERSRK